MLIVYRKWTRKQDEYAKYHKLQIPIEMDAHKLIKNLAKELKMDAVRLLFGPLLIFSISITLTHPVILF